MFRMFLYMIKSSVSRNKIKWKQKRCYSWRSEGNDTSKINVLRKYHNNMFINYCSVLHTLSPIKVISAYFFALSKNTHFEL